MSFSVMLKHQELVVTITKGVAPGQTETAWFQGSGLGCAARDPPGYGACALACADCLCWKIGAQISTRRLLVAGVRLSVAGGSKVSQTVTCAFHLPAPPSGQRD